MRLGLLIWLMALLPVYAIPQEIRIDHFGSKLIPGHYEIVLSIDENHVRYELFQHWYYQSYLKVRDLILSVNDSSGFSSEHDSVHVFMKNKHIELIDARYRINKRVRKKAQRESVEVMRNSDFAYRLAENDEKVSFHELFESQDLNLPEEQFQQKVKTEFEKRTFAQTGLMELTVNFIDSIKQSNSDTIIEVRINSDGQKHFVSAPSTYIYFKNNPKFHYKYCGKKFYGNSSSLVECNNNWATLFNFISDHLATLRVEKLLPDTVSKSNGKLFISSPEHYDIVEIIVHTEDNVERIKIRKDFFLPSDNRHYKENILTKSYLFLNLIENCNNQIDKNNHR
jgi:hypothetical protein